MYMCMCVCMYAMFSRKSEIVPIEDDRFSLQSRRALLLRESKGAGVLYIRSRKTKSHGRINVLTSPVGLRNAVLSHFCIKCFKRVVRKFLMRLICCAMVIRECETY